MTNAQDNGRQGGTHTQSSGITSTPAGERAPRRWTKKEMMEAKPVSRPAPPGLARRAEQVENWPTTFVPPDIAGQPYAAMCKVFYRLGDAAYQASAWIVSGNTGRKGIITAAHVIHDRGVWATDFMVCRQYSQGIWVEEFLSQTGRVLNGWLHGDGVREFWDVGAIIPSADVPAMTPAIPAVFGFNPNEAPFNAFYDCGYPGQPALGYPFNGELLWESDGGLAGVERFGDQVLLAAYNAMKQGSSGSPWLIHDRLNNRVFAAGVQSCGPQDLPIAYSPYFDQRNIVPLLRDIGVMS